MFGSLYFLQTVSERFACDPIYYSLRRVRTVFRRIRAHAVGTRDNDYVLKSTDAHGTRFLNRLGLNGKRPSGRSFDELSRPGHPDK